MNITEIDWFSGGNWTDNSTPMNSGTLLVQRWFSAVSFVLRIPIIALYIQFIRALITHSARQTIGVMYMWYFALGIADVWYFMVRCVMDIEVVLQLEWNQTVEILQTLFYSCVAVVPYFTVPVLQLLMSGLRLLVVLQPLKYKKLKKTQSLILISIAWLFGFSAGVLQILHPRIRNTFDWRINRSRKLAAEPLPAVVAIIACLCMISTLSFYIVLSVVLVMKERKTVVMVQPLADVQAHARNTTQSSPNAAAASATPNIPVKMHKVALKIGDG